MNTAFQKPDLHMHSVFSDGTDTPEQLLANVRMAGLDVFALTDHDTYDGCALVSSLLTESDPLFIPGIELSCTDAHGKYHILGYGYNPLKPSLRNCVSAAHQTRITKVQKRIAYLSEVKGIPFSEAEIAEILSNRNPGKPHIARMLIKKGYASEIREGIRMLSDYHDKERTLTPEEAIDAILRADGLPVLAHGILADGSKNLSEELISERVTRLKAYGLMGLECYYSAYTEEQKEIMLSLARQNNLFVTAGSDYHGANKPVRLGETNAPDPAHMERFYTAVTRLLKRQ